MSASKQTTLPEQHFPENRRSGATESDGFVDEEVLLAMITGGSRTRVLASSQDLVLPADDMDFAGWTMPEPLPSRFTPPPVSTTSLDDHLGPARTRQKETPVPIKNIAARGWFTCMVGITFSLSLAALIFALWDRGLLPWGEVLRPDSPEVHGAAALESTTEPATTKSISREKSE